MLVIVSEVPAWKVKSKEGRSVIMFSTIASEKAEIDFEINVKSLTIKNINKEQTVRITVKKTGTNLG